MAERTAGVGPYGALPDNLTGGKDEVEGIYPPDPALIAEPVPEDVQRLQAKRLADAWETP